ncbi:somatostatin receptor type 5-like [Patiria miniata]|uniref:G-protein coupled receptors family 1 profile domain-containing protein n=1 Tax=Patiria miniata TaxID=46514 RepID=A0A913YZX4_PATMI|nr:somatostatin receptor type 5-like [Patiria miniata]
MEETNMVPYPDLIKNDTFQVPQATPSQVLIGLELLIGAIGLIGNTLVVLTIYRSKNLHYLTNYLILNLAIADALLCLCSLLNPWLLWGKFASDVLPYCFTTATIDSYLEVQIYSIFQRGLANSSPMCLLLVTVERFVGIVHPLGHPDFFQPRKLTTLLFLTWIIPFLLELPTGLWFIIKYINNNCWASNAEQEPLIVLFPILSSTLSVLVPIIAMIAMYSNIMRNLKRNARSLEHQGINGPPQELHRAHQRVVNTLILVTIAFILLVFPSRVIFITTVANLVNTEPQPVVEQQIVIILGALNSSINPFFYGFKYDKFRKALIAMICCKRRGNNVVPLRIEVTTVNGTGTHTMETV